MGNHKKLLQFLRPDPAVAAAPATKSSSSTTSDDEEDDDYSYYGDNDNTSCSTPTTTASASTAASPYASSPWTQLPGLMSPRSGPADDATSRRRTGLLGSLVKEGGGHVYSLAAAGDLLYTGTDSRNVRVWRDRRELGGGFKSGSGLVKAIVVVAADGGRIYTGHQDGKVRVWRRRASSSEKKGEEDDPAVEHQRVGSLPRFRDVLRSSLRPSQYVQTRRRHSGLWMRHFDAVSSLSLDAAAGLIYSASWDRTFKVWRVSDSKCLESVYAHTDAVNAVAAVGFDALVLTGSADGTVKVWRRGAKANGNKKKKKKGRRDDGDTWHTMERVLREGDSAVTAIAVAVEARVVYVGSSDGAVSHWQWRRGAGPGAAPRNGGALWGHKMAVLCLAVAGGRVVVSGSADRTINVWRREEGADHARLAVLTGHTGPVKCVAMDQEVDEDDADGPRRWVVYSGSLDGSVKVWRVSDSGGGGGGIATPDLTTTSAATPTRYSWKGSSPSPLRSWTPYAAAATPEPRHMGAA
ncbi:protein JINGUBANG [Sorghum bicolor]|uniref:protein JINGUBANG n=1 Tax=Sorghum bicolor TaxID=4558 RepID=UPI00081ACC9B|nr:protein JINGUBANG [Sorghum bicolor]|eukprot:XP_002442434.2 protein JINGUBANG [Sorghum bicolor]